MLDRNIHVTPPTKATRQHCGELLSFQGRRYIGGDLMEDKRRAGNAIKMRTLPKRAALIYRRSSKTPSANAAAAIPAMPITAMARIMSPRVAAGGSAGAPTPSSVTSL